MDQYQPGREQAPQFERSIDYLDQIAPATRQKALPTKFILIGVVIAAIIAVFLFIGIALNGRPSTSEQMMKLYARLNTLQTITSTEQKSLKDTQLRTANSSLSLLLTNSIRDIGKTLTTGSSNGVKVPQTLTASEKAYAQKLTDKFTDAKLNVELDSTYAREMAYQLSLVHTMMKSLYNGASSNSTKMLLQQTSDTLTPLQQTFSDFSGSKE